MDIHRTFFSEREGLEIVRSRNQKNGHFTSHSFSRGNGLELQSQASGDIEPVDSKAIVFQEIRPIFSIRIFALEPEITDAWPCHNVLTQAKHIFAFEQIAQSPRREPILLNHFLAEVMNSIFIREMGIPQREANEKQSWSKVFMSTHCQSDIFYILIFSGFMQQIIIRSGKSLLPSDHTSGKIL